MWLRIALADVAVHHAAIEEIAAAKLEVDSQVVVQALTLALVSFEMPDSSDTDSNTRGRVSVHIQFVITMVTGVIGFALVQLAGKAGMRVVLNGVIHG